MGLSRIILSSRWLVAWCFGRPRVRHGPSSEPRVVAGSIGLHEVDLVLDRIDVHQQLRHVDAMALGKAIRPQLRVAPVSGATCVLVVFVSGL